MTALRYKQIQGDHILFVKYLTLGGVTVMLVYVDDIIVIGHDWKEQLFIQHLAKEFEIKTLGRLKYFLSGKASNGACESQIKESHDSGPESIRANVHVTIKDGEHDESHEDDMNTENHDESESLSDIDVQEIDGCLLNAEETQFRTIIWENMNKDYLEEQAAKQAAVAKSTKEIKPRRAQEAKNLGPAQSPLEACHRTLEKKRVRVNEDALKRLFDKHDAAENPKKVRFELPFVDFESKLEDKIKDDEEGSMDEFEGDDMNGGYENTLYQENAYETYDYDYDYEHDGYSYDR